MKEGDRVVITNPRSPLRGMAGTVTRLRPRPTSEDAADVQIDGGEGSSFFQPQEIQSITTVIELTLTLDEPLIRTAYGEYVDDYMWYVENDPGELAKHTDPRSHYAPGGPVNWDIFLAGWRISILEDVVKSGFGYELRVS
jgi:hypothetical protein